MLTAHTVRDGLIALSVAFALALAVMGCGDTAPAEHVAQDDAPLLSANDETAFNYFVGKGLTTYQAAGIVGNLDQESQMIPTAVQSGGPGRGIAQWSVGGRWDTDANDNAVAYASKESASVYSLELQLDFIWYELTTFSGYGLTQLRNTTNVTDATVVFQTDFEGCGTCDQTTRVSYAQQTLTAYGAIPYGASFVAQSFPLATTTLTMVEGQVLPSYIELKNTGTKTWTSSTRIGTTEPRDRTSVFADTSWVNPGRPAAVAGTVAPGASFKFVFNLTAPMTAGTYDEHFGVVQEGVAWFGDPGEGGPADTDLEVKIVVVAPQYRGAFKDQSFPPSPSPLVVHQGDVTPGYIELTNTGTATWKAGTTKLAPIPRDVASPFVDPSWLSPTRVSTVATDVAPGDVGRFPVTLDAPSIGDTEIAFGLVEENVTWFADALAGGGPADGALAVHLVVVQPGAPLDAGLVENEGGAAYENDGGTLINLGGDDTSDAKGSGCSVGAAPVRTSWWSGAGVVIAVSAVAGARRRKRDRR